MENKLLKIGGLLGLLMIAFSIFYYLVIFMPNKEATRVHEQEEKQIINEENTQKAQKAKQDAEAESIANQALINACLAIAKNSYSKNITANCLTKPVPQDDGSSNCQVNPDVLKSLQNIYQQEQNTCFDKYK